MISRPAAIAALLVVAALGTVPANPSSGAAVQVVTCRGLQPTHVGVPGDDLVTTPAADVVVTNGARHVRTLGGDDVICATRARLVDIVPGAGDDIVDTTGYHGSHVDADLGEASAEGSSGDDTYIGGDQWDEIALSSGTATDHKQIDMGGQFDFLYVYGGYRGTLTAALGAGNDSYFTPRPRAGVDVDGGADLDDYYTLCARCVTAAFDLGAGPIQVNDRPAGSALGFDFFRVFHRRHQMAQHVTVIGSERPDHIDVSACTAELHGAGGNDFLYTFPELSLCEGIGSEVFGDDGDDSLYGTNGHDELRGRDGDDHMFGRRGRDDLGGGPGHDRADGDEGRDHCRAEVEVDCEV